MRFMSGDESESMEMWTSTYEYRFNDNKASKDLSTILDRWRFYKQASGMKYVRTLGTKLYINTGVPHQKKCCTFSIGIAKFRVF